MFAALFIPDFSLQAVLRQQPELSSRPVALVDQALPKPILVQVTSTARSAGVVEGLTPSQATARCGDLIIRTRSPAQEQTVSDLLLQTAYAFSPNIELTVAGVCTLELTGLGIDSAAERDLWAARILEKLAQFHLHALIGFGVTPELALIAARNARPILTLEHGTAAGHGSSVQSIEFFAVSALNPPAELLDVLNRWGIKTIGAFLALGKERVTERLGTSALKLFDRISPEAVRPLRLTAPPAEFFEELEFEIEVETIEPLLFVLRRFTEQLARRLETIYMVVEELHLRLALSSGDRHERVFRMPSPTSNIATLFRMLQTHLETVRTNSPIVSVRLGAKPCKPEAHQFGLFEATLRDPNQFAETLARLMALCGPDRVGTPHPEETHRPDSFRMNTACFETDAELNERKRGNRETGDRVVGRISRTNLTRRNVKDPARPALALRRFRPALTATVEFRENRPALLRFSIFSGPVRQSRGPFITSGNWWDRERWAREEWDVETSDGSLYRIFRSDDGCFVEGVYD